MASSPPPPRCFLLPPEAGGVLIGRACSISPARPLAQAGRPASELQKRRLCDTNSLARSALPPKPRRQLTVGERRAASGERRIAGASAPKGRGEFQRDAGSWPVTRWRSTNRAPVRLSEWRAGGRARLRAPGSAGRFLEVARARAGHHLIWGRRYLARASLAASRRRRCARALARSQRRRRDTCKIRPSSYLAPRPTLSGEPPNERRRRRANEQVSGQ